MPNITATSPLKDPLKESNRLNLYPKLDFEEPSPLRSSPTRINHGEQNVTSTLGKPPTRISPFKGAKSSMSATEIFATTPKRIFNSKTQSVDRYGFNNQSSTTEEKPNITFSSLKGLAASNLRTGSHTPSRMVRGRRAAPSSEQPSRLGRISMNIKGKDVNENLMEKFASQNGIKPCLKSHLPVPVDHETKAGPNDSDYDLTTSINTIKNANSAKNVKAFLQSNDEPEAVQPRKKRRAVTFTSGLNSIAESPGKDDVQKMLHMILENQKVIIDKLKNLEDRIS